MAGGRTQGRKVAVAQGRWVAVAQGREVVVALERTVKFDEEGGGTACAPPTRVANTMDCVGFCTGRGICDGSIRLLICCR